VVEIEPKGQPRRDGTVIVVDDQPAMCDIMVQMLEGEGYRVLSGQDGDEGWELFRQAYQKANGRPLMVVTDHEMPGMLGRELASKVKEVDERVPVVVVSGYAVEGSGPEDALIAKPFTIDQFLGCVKKTMHEVWAKSGAAL